MKALKVSVCGRRFARCRVAIIGLVMVAGGCRLYAPAPLDLPATRSAWLARSPSDETARAFADRLARADGRVASAFDPSDGLTLVEAEAVALVFNRDLRLARLEANVSRVTADHAGLWDDPVLGVDIEGIVSGVSDPWVVAGTVGLTIPISGRLEAEKARASAAYGAELQRVGAQEWAARAALRELWMRWSGETAHLELVTALVERLRSVAELADRQERAGSMSRIDARLFRVELASGEAEVIAATARATGSELRLRDMLGLAPATPLELVPSIAFAAPRLEPERLRSAMEIGNLELAWLRDEYAVAEESLRLEIRKQHPDLVIGPGYGADQGDERVLLGVRLPIALWNRNQQGVAQASARRDAARARFESMYEHLASRLAIAQSRSTAGRSVREAIEYRVLPLADEQDAEARRVAELGRVDPLLLLQSIRSQHEAKARLVDARVEEAIGAIMLEELIGPAAYGGVGVAPPSPASESSDQTEGGRP